MPEEENEDKEKGYGPIRSSKLKSYAKNQTSEMYDGEEMWANDEAIALLEQQLLEVARYVWTAAAEETWRDGRRTVKPNEIDTAFNELLHPQNVLQEAANEMQTLRWRFLDVAEGSPAINPDDVRRPDEEPEEETREEGEETRNTENTSNLDEFMDQ
jgi:histone H3/H4